MQFFTYCIAIASGSISASVMIYFSSYNAVQNSSSWSKFIIRRSLNFIHANIQLSSTYEPLFIIFQVLAIYFRNFCRVSPLGKCWNGLRYGFSRFGICVMIAAPPNFRGEPKTTASNQI